MPTILIIDDSEADRLLLRRHLAAEGAEVVEAATVEAARQHIDTGAVDVVLCDILIPPHDGTEALSLVVAAARRRGLPVVAVSGLADVEAWRSVAASVGVTFTVSKDPADMERLPWLVQVLLALSMSAGTQNPAVREVAATLDAFGAQLEVAILAMAEHNDRSGQERAEILSALQRLTTTLEAVEGQLQRRWSLKEVIEWWGSLTPRTRGAIWAALVTLGSALGWWGVNEIPMIDAPPPQSVSVELPGESEPPDSSSEL